MSINPPVYRPKWYDLSKGLVYAKYFAEYLKYGDFRSLGASLKYVFTHKLPRSDFETRSGMGKFYIRKQTTDFQFVNFAYEYHLKRYLLDHINDFDVFIDAGACIGEYDIWLSQLGKKCIAIEPVNFQALSKNIELNGLKDKIQAYNVGVGDKREMVHFEILEHVTSSSHIERGSDKAPNVQIETLDELSKKFGLRPEDRVILKIDVESMEEEVINGAVNFIRSTPKLQVIYEDYPADNLKNDKHLASIEPAFRFESIDQFNRIAIK